MLRRRRLRHDPYPLTRQRTARGARWAGIILILIGAYLGWRGMRWLTVERMIDHPPAIATMERGHADLALDEGEPQQVEGTVNMYADDRIVTRDGGSVMITFFDGTLLRMDGETELQIESMQRGNGQNEVTLFLSRGNIWLQSPESIAFSGSILRRVRSDTLQSDLPPGTEAVFTPSMLTVFSSGDAPGILLHSAGNAGEPITIGEGQQFALPESVRDRNNNLYAHRAPLAPDTHTLRFVEESRKRKPSQRRPPLAPSPPAPPEDILTILEPREREWSSSATIFVQGTMGKDVYSIRVNGHPAAIDRDTHTFAQELALPNEESVEIRIAALDEKGVIIAERLRIVRRDIKPPSPPTITSPSGSGTLFQTQRTELEIRGSAPVESTGIIVNDYRLQLFQPGARQWSYLASTNLGNLAPGLNTYAIIAIDAAGNRSAPAVITILLAPGEEGIVQQQGRETTLPAGTTENEQRVTPAPEQSSVQGTTSNKQREISLEDILPQNAPLLPGSLTVDTPTDGTPYTTNRWEFSIYGSASPDTASMWVNGYRLRLFEPGQTRWKYIASHQMGTMKRGKNTYMIIARNAEGQILDRREYTVIFKPERE